MKSLIRQFKGANWWFGCILFSFLLLTNPFQLLAEAPEGASEALGKGLFEAKCKSCHYTWNQKNTGPGLYGYRDRVPSEDWLYQWIRDPQGMINSGDAYANKIWDENKPNLMTAFGSLTDVEIASILLYLDNNTTPDPPGADTANGETGDPREPAEEEDNTALIFWLAALAIVFYIVVKVLGMVKTSLINLDRSEKGQEPRPDVSNGQAILNWIGNNKKYAALIAIVLVSIGATNGWYALKGIAVYQDYEPEQPIWFSHKIHAGQNAIECVYCHHSAEKGKAAGIPSVNVCMNCHVAIPEGSITGKEEIAKIYKAAGWDDENQKYTGETEPIKWVKVHNLPDFAYFNHSQHVVVGNQECQTCHGPVEEMHVLKQHSELTMGWCINCHRETQVTMDEDNEYYQDLKKDLIIKHQELGLQEFTVEQIGGLECAKCHY